MYIYISDADIKIVKEMHKTNDLVLLKNSNSNDISGVTT